MGWTGAKAEVVGGKLWGKNDGIADLVIYIPAWRDRNWSLKIICWAMNFYY